MGACCGSKERRLLIIGLNGVGKTTAIVHLQPDKSKENIQPTGGFSVETIIYKNDEYKCWDVAERHMWEHFYESTHGLIFVVDSSSRKRVGEAKEALKELLPHTQLKNTPLLVLANKQDTATAMKVQDITEELQLTNINDRPWYIQGTTATTGEGLDEGMEWMASQINE